MKLVTFTVGNAAPRAGLLVEDGRKVLDLQGAYGRVYRGTSAALASVLAIIEAGPQALDMIQPLAAVSSPDVTFALDEVRLLAPVPQTLNRLGW
ncbi:MAG TPA: hypothetical protein VM489_15690 [Burkholderiales bacterium]|nr:hypothetical protein [Burkholderiales bacterium]